MPFFFLFVDSFTATHGKLQQVFGDDAMSRAQAFRWRKMFSEGRTVVEIEQLGRRPSATRTGDDAARVRKLVRSVRLILTDELGTRTTLPRWFPGISQSNKGMRS
jgi:ParB-like chromosome segregation protein Spo0J